MSFSKNLVTSIVTISFAGLYALGLFALAIWLTFEKWHFRRVVGSTSPKLTGGSLPNTLFDQMVYGGRNLNASSQDSLDFSLLEKGGYPIYDYMKYLPDHMIWDGFQYNFLPGSTPSSHVTRQLDEMSVKTEFVRADQATPPPGLSGQERHESDRRR